MSWTAEHRDSCGGLARAAGSKGVNSDGMQRIKHRVNLMWFFKSRSNTDFGLVSG